MLASENKDKMKALTEYMEKEFGVTPNNIDEKLQELKKQFYERRSQSYEKCQRVQ